MRQRIPRKALGGAVWSSVAPDARPMVGAKGADLPASPDRRRVAFPFQLLLEQQALASIALLEREQDNGRSEGRRAPPSDAERGPPAGEKPTVEAVFDKSQKGALLWSSVSLRAGPRT